MKKLFILILILASSCVFNYFQTQGSDADKQQLVREKTIQVNGGYIGENANER